MEVSILDKFLESQLLPSAADDDTYGKLEEAAGLLAKVELKRLDRIPQFLLAALDPNISVDDSTILAAKQRVSTQSRTIIPRSGDSPTTLLRAIILEALAIRCKESEEAARIVWLIGGSFVQYFSLTKEEANVIHDFLKQIGEDIEERIVHEWALQPGIENNSSKIEAFEITNWKAVKVPSSQIPSKIQIEVPPSNTTGNPLLAAMSGGGAAEGSPTIYLGDEINSELQNVFKKSTEYARDVNKGTQEKLNIYFKEIVNELKALSRSKKGAWRLHFQSQLLWWKEALYSASTKQNYRQIEPYLLPVVMAFDVVKEFPIKYPASVNHFLAETFSIVQKDDVSLTFSQFFEGILKANGEGSMPQLSGKIDNSGGRHLLSEFTAELLIKEKFDRTQFKELTGIDPEAETSLLALCLWFFQEFQALRLCQK